MIETKLAAEIKKGDEILESSGIFFKVIDVEIGDRIVKIEAENPCLIISRVSMRVKANRTVIVEIPDPRIFRIN